MHLLALRQVTLAVGQVSLSTLMKFLFSVEGEYFSALYVWALVLKREGAQESLVQINLLWSSFK